MLCPRCGHENHPSSTYCMHCNCNLQTDVESYRPDLQMTVILPATPGKLEMLTPPPAFDAANDPLETSLLDNLELGEAPPDASPAPVASAPADQAAVPAPRAAREERAAAAKPAPLHESLPPLPTHLPPSNVQGPIAETQAAKFSIIIGTASIVLMAVAVAYYAYNMRKSEAQYSDSLPPVAGSLPNATASKPMPAPVATPVSAPAPVVASVSAPAPVAQASAPVIVASSSAPPEVAASKPAPKEEPATQSAPPAPVAAPAATGPHALKETEIAALLKELKKQRHPPGDCDAAAQMLINEHDVLPKQAPRIAKRAYPDLCAPKPKAVQEAAPVQRPVMQEPAPAPVAAPKPRTLDEQYEERISAECSKGAFGFVCRESIRVKLCSGKITDNPPPGQSICKQ